MARRVILDTLYTFIPSTQTVVIPRIVQRERLLLITNVTSNKVIYNFSDPSLTATSYSIAQNTNATDALTTVVLTYNTTAMSSTDHLQIVVDEINESFEPAEAYQDPVGKFRISSPQALIDTDFEYGLQPTKWEQLTLMNNRPAFYYNAATPITITNVNVSATGSNVSVWTAQPPAIGTPIYMQDTIFVGANGPFIVETSAATNFTYTARYPANVQVTTNLYNSALTTAFSGNLYTGAAYTLVAQPINQGNVLTINTVDPHGLTVGDSISIYGATATTNAPNGSYQVATVLNATNLQVITNNVTTGSITLSTVVPRPDSNFVHRAYDGGVQFTTGNPAHNIQAIRQTRRYFRYQSGKGIQISTGTILKPNINVDDVSSNGAVVTVTTKQAHQLNPGVTITMAGCNETAYNGSFQVATVINAVQFTYNAVSTPSASPASGIPVLSVTSWYGAATKLGMFDSQNGFYFEFNGQNLYAVRRYSTYQIAGFVNVTNGSATITGATVNGVTTKFSKQLTPGDFIVIRGMSYRVLNIASDTSLTVSPPYRGATLSGNNTAIVSKTQETRVAQSSFNIDPLDGTGPSGLVLDLSRMQMFYLDYSWYGAGAIRMGFRDTQGKVFYCHRFVNSNQNYEAYMRSGNLPGRYEVNTFSPITVLTANVAINDTVISVASTSGFPSTGTLLIADGNVSAGFEYVNYTGTTSSTFTGLTRGKGNAVVSSVSLTNNSANVTTSSSVSGIQTGMYVYNNQYPGGIPNGTYVYQVTTGSPNIITLTQAATATQTSTLTFQAMGSAANAHVYSSTAPIPVSLHAPQFAPTISHWGTSVIMDGRFDDDKSLIFTYGETTSVVVQPNNSQALLSIRCSPSVDSGVPNSLGLKEIVNRMQLKLFSTDVLSAGNYLITLVLNGNVVSAGGTVGTFGRIATGTSSLAQIADHLGNVQITGGEVIYGFYAVNSAGGSNFSVNSADLTPVRDLGNSILGGGLTNAATTSVYPDGPDVVTVVAQNIGQGNSTVQTRISWTEAQA